MARQLSGPSESWGTLLVHAQSILESHTDTNESSFRDSYDFESWKDLIAAARILDQAATNNGLTDAEDRRTAATLAACAFGMSGTAVSAMAVIRSHGLLEAGLTPDELTALALSAPALSREIFTKLPEGSPQRSCVENIAAFLATGRDEEIKTAQSMLTNATIQARDDWEGSLLRLSRLSLAHLERLSTMRVLKPHRERFPEGYLDRLASDAPTLLPSQYEAIESQNILDQARNLLVSLPTGTGKTLLGELALLSSLGGEPGLVCYVAPYIALGRQVAERISSHAPERVRVTPLMGGYKEPSPLDPETRMEVVVATPERLDAVLRLRNELIPWIRCIVFDEAHLIANGQRGIRLEGIITRFKLNTLRRDRNTRFILLSAVLSNTDELARWIGIGSDYMVRGTWRPSAKRLLRWTDDGVLRLHAGDDPMRDSPEEVLGHADLTWPNPHFYPATHQGHVRSQRPLELDNVAYLAHAQLRQHQQPVLCICAGRAKTIQLASRISQRLPTIEPTPESIRRVMESIDAHYPYLLSLRRILQHGVAYHNSSLPPEIRTGIERAVEHRDLHVVAATTTLAEGVDLPFRVTILADWLMFDGEKNSPMQSLLFKNIAGRCGRAGQFTEGDTVIFDNPVGDFRYTHPASRRALQHEIFFSESQPTLTSAINRIEEKDAVGAIGSQMLAAIHENQEEENLADLFLENCFAHQAAHTDGNVSRRVHMAVEEVLNERDGEPLAVASSPIKLTPFGEAARMTGLTPNTARRLRETIRNIAQQQAEGANLVGTCRSLLEALGDVPEQTNEDLRKAVLRPRSLPIVRRDEFAHVLDGWLQGIPVEDIFATTPSKTRSKHRSGLRPWLNGTQEDEFWTDEFAKFTDFINNVIMLFLPWMLRSADPIAGLEDTLDIPWSEWANFVEAGVDNSWAFLLYDGDIIDDRRTARETGRVLEEITEGKDPSISDFQAALRETVGHSPRTMNQAIRWFVSLTR